MLRFTAWWRNRFKMHRFGKKQIRFCRIGPRQKLPLPKKTDTVQKNRSRLIFYFLGKEMFFCNLIFRVREKALPASRFRTKSLSPIKRIRRYFLWLLVMKGFLWCWKGFGFDPNIFTLHINSI